MNKPPEIIYLQIYDGQGEYLDPVTGEVTWCVDQINPTDVEYRRVKKHIYIKDLPDAVQKQIVRDLLGE